MLARAQPPGRSPEEDTPEEAAPEETAPQDPAPAPAPKADPADLYKDAGAWLAEAGVGGPAVEAALRESMVETVMDLTFVAGAIGARTQPPCSRIGKA